MHEKRLLERLRDIERAPDYRGPITTTAVVESILLHVGKLLNTRQGSVPIAQDYGIPDFTDLAASFCLDSIPEIEETLKNIVTKYEPRLIDAKLKFVPKPEFMSMVCFKLEGRIRLSEVDIPVSFETILTADGRLKLSEGNL